MTVTFEDEPNPTIPEEYQEADPSTNGGAEEARNGGGGGGKPENRPI